MTTRPYELLARFKSDGTIAGLHVKTITTVNGRDFEGDPVPLATTNDPAFDAFKDAFNLAAATELEEVKAQLTTANARIAELLQEIPFDPNVIDATAFLNRITSEETFKLFASDDANVQAIATMLKDYKANDWPIVLSDERVVGAIGYLQQVGMIDGQRAAEIVKPASKAEAYAVGE